MIEDLSTSDKNNSTRISVPKLRKMIASVVTRPVVRLLARTSISPNGLTWIGFFLSIITGVLIGAGHPVAAGIMVLVSGFFDILDGALARLTNQTSRFGGVLDSTFDRLAEVAVLLGILVFYAGEGMFAQIILVNVTLAGSLLVSYTRARAEAAGLKCEEGLFTRPERVIVLALGLLLNYISIALVIIAVFSYITVGQRLFNVWRQTRDD